MSFYATRFIFDGTQSEKYSLTISSLENGESTTNFPGDVKLYTEKLFRRTDEFLYGVSIEPMLEFPVLFITDNIEITAKDAEIIGKWLFGRNTYKKLRIMQPDMQDLYYDCFLKEPKIMRVGNIIRGFSALVHCRTPWGLTSPKTFTYGDGTVTHYNDSDHSGYVYPKTIITADAYGGDLIWTNITDNNRQSAIMSINANEIITIDNSLQTISSSLGLNRLSNFNKTFFRLLSGKNILHINSGTSTPAIASFVIQYPLARKIGG